LAGCNFTALPFHPKGGCGFARHGTYERVTPPGTLITRYYCPTAHCTFSLLPDCLAARMQGTLEEIEGTVRAAEQAPSQEKACDKLGTDIQLPGLLRWLRRRLHAVYFCLMILKGLFAARFADCAVSIEAFSACLDVSPVLPRLRAIAAPYLKYLPGPIGFSPRHPKSGNANRENQHKVGTDPPSQYRYSPVCRQLACLSKEICDEYRR
jgi:hypothetical protein